MYTFIYHYFRRNQIGEYKTFFLLHFKCSLAIYLLLLFLFVVLVIATRYGFIYIFVCVFYFSFGYCCCYWCRSLFLTTSPELRFFFTLHNFPLWQFRCWFFALAFIFQIVHGYWPCVFMYTLYTDIYRYIYNFLPISKTTCILNWLCLS